MLERIEQYVPDTVEGCSVGGKCVYSQPANGQRCGVGAMLGAVDVLKASNIGSPIGSLLGHLPELRERLPLPLDGLRGLQQTHDQWASRARLGDDTSSVPTARARCRSWILENVEED